MSAIRRSLYPSYRQLLKYHHISCLIVKTDAYSEEEVAKVVQLRANVEGLKLGSGVLEKLAKQGERSSLRYVTSVYLSGTPTLFSSMTLSIPSSHLKSGNQIH